MSDASGQATPPPKPKKISKFCREQGSRRKKQPAFKGSRKGIKPSCLFCRLFHSKQPARNLNYTTLSNVMELLYIGNITAMMAACSGIMQHLVTFTSEYHEQKPSNETRDSTHRRR